MSQKNEHNVSEGKTLTIPIIIRRTTEQFHTIFVLSNQTLLMLLEKKDFFLHAREQTYYKTLKVEVRQHSYLLGRYVAKNAVSTCVNETDPRKIEITRGVFQQPVVQYPSDQSLQVSISHSQHWGAALAYPETHPMAIDVEFIDTSRLLSDIVPVTQNEKSFLLNLNFTEIEKLTLMWSIKEALSKVLKTGLMAELSIYEISNIKFKGKYFESQFVNFAQYQVISWFAYQCVWSIVLPKKSSLDIVALIDQQQNRFAEI